MGLDELSGNGITVKVLYFLTDRTMTPYNEPLRRVRKSRIFLFVAVQVIAFGVTFAITQTIGAPAFTFRHVNVERIKLTHCSSFVLCCASRGWVSRHHPVVDTTTNSGSAAFAVLRYGVRNSRQAYRVSFRELLKPCESSA
jgi:hypothetical protein